MPDISLSDGVSRCMYCDMPATIHLYDATHGDFVFCDECAKAFVQHQYGYDPTFCEAADEEEHDEQ